MPCCGPRSPRALQCAYCDADLSEYLHKCRTVLFYGKVLRFCAIDCQRAFFAQWDVAGP